MIKTTIEIDKNLLKKAMKIFSGKTKKEVFTTALREYIKRRERKEHKDLRELFECGDVWLAEDYDYKKLRGDVV